MPPVSFETVVEAEDTGIMIEIPSELIAALGKGKRPPVRATINDFTYRTTVSVYSGRFYLPVRREIRESAKLTAGDTVAITLELDEEPRIAEIPGDLAHALGVDPAAQGAFEKLSYTHSKEYVRWIESAKRPETRGRRIQNAMTMLRDGVKTPDGAPRT